MDLESWLLNTLLLDMDKWEKKIEIKNKLTILT